jgi:hypothetical protein
LISAGSTTFLLWLSILYVGKNSKILL